tara:strand:+ start:114 stop:290 length:177 start_codon:yes stop_codon:yes gene_type:complete
MSRLHNYIEFIKGKGITKDLQIDDIKLNEDTHKYTFGKGHLINDDKKPLGLSGTTIMK